MRKHITLAEADALLRNNRILCNMPIQVSVMADMKNGKRATIFVCDIDHANVDDTLSAYAKCFGPTWEYTPVVELKIGHANMNKELRVEMVLGTVEDVTQKERKK